MPNLPTRQPRPRLRAANATYFVTWELQRLQPELSPAERTIVADTLRFFDGTRYDLHAWVVMNDHVHVVVRPRDTWALDAIVHSWRSFAANAIFKASTRGAPLWLRDGYDRVVLIEGEFEEKVRYVQRNPWERWPELAEYPWVWVAQ